MTKHLILAAMLLLWSVDVWGQGAIIGRITNKDGIALVGANVWLPEKNQGAATDRDGRYTLQNLSPGTYLLQVTYLGFEDYIGVVDFSATTLPAIVLQERAYAVDGLVVKSTRADGRTPMTFTNLNKKQIGANNLGQDLPFVLQWTPAAVVTSDAGTGIGYTGIRIRGTDPTRINVTVNGIPINDAESQGVFWVNMPDFASSTADIQIQRGVGTSTNGAAAFGATINLNTAKVQEKAYATVAGSVGSFNTFKRNIQFGTGLLNNHFTLDARLSRITSNGYIDRAHANLNAYYVSGAYVGKNNLLRFNVFSGKEITYQAWNGVPADLVNNRSTRTYNSAGTERPGTPYDNEIDHYKQTHFQLLYNQKMDDHWNFNAALHYTKGAGYFEQYKKEQLLSAYGLPPLLEGATENPTDLIRQLWLDNGFYGAVTNLNYHKKRWDITLGGGWNQYAGKQFGKLPWTAKGTVSTALHYYDGSSLKTDINAYAKFNYEMSKGLYGYLDLQIRGINYQIKGVDAFQRSLAIGNQLNFFNPKWGLFYQRNPQTAFFASMAVGQREPNRDDYVNATSNNPPKPERMLDTELGFKRQWAKGALEINGYHMYYRDQLALRGSLNEVGSALRVNIDRSYRLGIEINGGWQLLPALRLQGNAAFSKNKVLAFTEEQDAYDANFVPTGAVKVEHKNTDLSFSPQVVAGGELAFSPFQKASWLRGQQLTLSWLTRYVSRQFIDNTSDLSNVIPSYTFTDLRLVYRRNGHFFKNLTGTLWVQNLFDRQYSSNGWSYRYQVDRQTTLDRGYYPQAGRNVLLGLEIGF
jgi:iron complex outermembrane receptor protein